MHASIRAYLSFYVLAVDRSLYMEACSLKAGAPLIVGSDPKAVPPFEQEYLEWFNPKGNMAC